MVKLKEGKFYRNRRGEKVGPLKPLNLEKNPYEFYGSVVEGKGTDTFTVDGRIINGQQRPSDLIAEWIEPLRLQEGKFYRTRDGRKVGPARRHRQMSGLWGFTPESSSTHHMDGVTETGRENPDDIIAEWVDEDSSEPPKLIEVHSDGWAVNLSKLRDHFAVAALQSIGTWLPPHQARAGHFDLNSDEAIKARAEWAYRQADAMLKARHVAKS